LRDAVHPLFIISSIIGRYNHYSETDSGGEGRIDGRDSTQHGASQSADDAAQRTRTVRKEPRRTSEERRKFSLMLSIVKKCLKRQK